MQIAQAVAAAIEAQRRLTPPVEGVRHDADMFFVSFSPAGRDKARAEETETNPCFGMTRASYLGVRYVMDAQQVEDWRIVLPDLTPTEEDGNG